MGRPMKRGLKGFTLIELLIVVAIIGIIVAIAIPNLLNAIQRAKQKRTMAANAGTGFSPQPRPPTRRLREHGLFARTIQLKLRYKDFSTYTRAHSIDHGTQLDIELLEEVRQLFRKAWDGRPVRLLGVHAGSLEVDEGQLNLLDGGRTERWRKALSAADRMRDKFGERSVSMGAGMDSSFRERVHENPASLPGKHPQRSKDQ